MNGWKRGAAVSAAAFFTALLISAVFTILTAEDTGMALMQFFVGAFKNRLAFGNFLESAARLSIAGLGAALAFRSGLFNIGGEGQALAGGLAAACTAIILPQMGRPFSIVLSILTGICAGGFLGGISGCLKARWKVDELISSFLIAAAVIPVGNMLLSGPMKDADSYLLAAPPLPAAYHLPLWLPPSRLGPLVPWTVLLILAAFMFYYRTPTGYRWRLHGASPAFAEYGGIRVDRVTVLAMSVSGGLYGLAGTAALLDGGQAVQGFTNGLGWNGLAVALIAGTRMEFVPLAAVAFAWLESGSHSALIFARHPFAMTGLIQAVVFLLVTAGSRRR